MPGRADNHADDIINIATVETAYATFYRVHARSHFRSGASFPENWQPWPEKVTRAERFSPPESVGWYLGLTVAAAFDEAAYYQAQATTTPAPTVLLVIECCLSNILYLAWPPVLMALWEKLALPPTDVFGMQLAIMDRKTDNAITDRIGLWARERGFGGIIFPTARYDARVSLEEEIAKRVRPPLLVPVINYVPVWSRLEVQGGLHMTAGIGDQLRFACLSQRGLKDDETLDVPAELNVVLFSGEQLQGTRHPVFYQTFPMEAWREASAQETRRDTWRNTFHVDLGAKP